MRKTAAPAFNRSETLQRLFLLCALLTCSCEIFLVVNIGFNFKACQIFILLAGILFFIEWASSRSSLRLPNHVVFLAFALALSVLYWPNSDLPQRSIGYSLWFAFDVLGVVLFFNLFRTLPQFVVLLRVVLISVSINAFFGLSQFFLGVIGIDPPLVTQWWIEGRLPRINGFNYEPSFFATYLALGWVLSTYLWEKRAPLLGRKFIIVASVSSTVAMLMCSSRMGWFAMALWLFRPLAQTLGDLVFNGRIAVRRMRLLAVYVVASGVAIGSVFAIFSLDQLSVLVSGLGIVESSGSFSADERSETSRTTGLVALDHIFIGGGFGAVPSAIAVIEGITNPSLEDAKLLDGKNVTFELIASLGLIGAVSFYTFFFLTINNAIDISKKITENELSNSSTDLLALVLRGLCWALIIQIILLQLNQNILRAYTWIFIGILFATIRVASDNQKKLVNIQG